MFIGFVNFVHVKRNYLFFILASRDIFTLSGKLKFYLWIILLFYYFIISLCCCAWFNSKFSSKTLLTFFFKHCRL